MHSHSVGPWEHGHAFLGERHAHHEQRTWLVVALTTAMMAGEIAGGMVFGSMGLLADGWHMATHAAALAIAGFAYLFARRHVGDPRFSLGTGKFGELAGFTSAVILGVIAAFICYESVLRLVHPVDISFDESIAIASLGLGVNLLSAWLLREDHAHAHDDDDDHDDHDHGHAHHHADHNLKAAYVHVLTDALTSVLAIGGLLTARLFGWVWIDPMVGLLGAAVILRWAYGLIRSSGAVLLDAMPDRRLAERIREQIEVGGDRVADLHVWRLGPGHAAVILAVVSDAPQAPTAYKERIGDLHGLSHVTVEVHRCPGAHPC
jgi:cation diffusion facilitator family transporter